MNELFNCSCLYEGDKKILKFALDVFIAESKHILERIEKKELVGSMFYDGAFQKRTLEDIERARKIFDNVMDTPDCPD